MGKIVGYIPKAPVEVAKGESEPDAAVEPVEGAKPTSKAKVKKE